MLSVRDIFKKFGLCITFSPLFTHIFKIEDLKSAMEKIARIGYKGIELNIRDINDIDWYLFDRMLKDNNLELITLSTGLVRKIDNISLMDEDKSSRNEAIQRVVKMIEHFSNYNGEYKSILIGYLKGTISESPGKRQEQLKIIHNSLLEILEVAEKEKIQILIEVINHKETNFINNISEGIKFISDFNSSYLKLIVDSYHMSIEEKDNYQSIKKAKDYVGYVHLGDNPRSYPGSGNFDFKNLLKAFHEIDYKGYFSMEFGPPEQKFASIKEGYDYINRLII